MDRLKSLFFIIGLLFFGAHSVASTNVDGTLKATQACEAFVSKNKRNNPDQARLKIGENYTIHAINRAKNPTWYRLSVNDAKPKKRWVNKDCGQASWASGSEKTKTDTTQDKNQCQTAGLEDSYKLALSWQPAFCESNRTKPECNVPDKNAYEAKNFTLHGLWPNKKECNKDYGFCGKVRTKARAFCDYPALSLDADVRTALEQVMPSAKANTCLQRHEWYKHGTCQNKWNVNEYLLLAIDLSHQFNRAEVAQFVAQNIGRTVTEKSFFNVVDATLGQNASKRLQIICKNGMLSDIYINLPGDIQKDEPLAALVARANPDFGSNCGGKFRIDPIGY